MSARDLLTLGGGLNVPRGHLLVPKLVKAEAASKCDIGSSFLEAHFSKRLSLPFGGAAGAGSTSSREASFAAQQAHSLLAAREDKLPEFLETFCDDNFSGRQTTFS